MIVVLAHLTQVELRMPTGEYYYVPPSSSPFSQKQPARPPSRSGLSAQVQPSSPVRVPDREASHPSFHFAGHALMDDSNVPHISKRRQSIQVFAISSYRSWLYGVHTLHRLVKQRMCMREKDWRCRARVTPARLLWRAHVACVPRFR